MNDVTQYHYGIYSQNRIHTALQSATSYTSVHYYVYCIQDLYLESRMNLWTKFFESNIINLC